MKAACILSPSRRSFHIVSAAFSRSRVLSTDRKKMSSLNSEAKDIKESKKKLRAEIRSYLRRITPQQLHEDSSKICFNVLNMDIYRQAKRIGLYIHCSRLREVNTSWIVAESFLQGKQVFCPRVLDQKSRMEFLHAESDQDLKPMPPFGILEPTPNYLYKDSPRLNAAETGLDLLLVPGLAFHTSGARLGRGGGYYDAFIDSLKTPLPRIVALAFPCQLLTYPDVIPTTSSDHKVDIIVTPSSVINCE